MEVPARRITLLMNVVMLLVAHVHLHYAHESDAAFARIVPTRLQLYEYGSISFDCEGFDTTAGWTVMRKIKGGEVSKCVSNWEHKTLSVCAINPIYLSDSGEYWCETGKGERSKAVNITVTAGSVILESPVLPVMEGEAVTLRCRSKMSSCAHVTDFFKDRVFFGTGSIGEMTIQSVSKSDEGLYKCSISDFGESPESRLTVRALQTETRPSSDHSCHIYLVLRTVFTAVTVALLLLLLGILHRGKLHKITHV